MANFGMVSDWHRLDQTQELDTFRGIFKKGDIIEIKDSEMFHYWSICTQDGPEPRMAHRFVHSDDLCATDVPYGIGSVNEFGLVEVHRVHNIRINNFRDRITSPKPIEDVVHCALEAVGTMGEDQFGLFHDHCNNDLDFVEQVRYPKDSDEDKVGNVGMVSEWHYGDKTQDMDTFCDILKKGDIIQIKNSGNFYYWAICTRDGHEPKMVHRFGRDFFLFPIEFNDRKGSVHQIGLDEVRRAKGIIRINNSMDRTTIPKPLRDMVRCARGAVGMMGDYQFGPFHLHCNSDLDFVLQVRYPKHALDNRLDEQGCSPYYTIKEFESFAWLIMVGDMVEFNRVNVYSHWAVVVDRPLHWWECHSLVHRYGSGDSLEFAKKLIGRITRSPFEEVIKGCNFRINNSRDMTHWRNQLCQPKDAIEIRRFATDSLESNAFGKYNVAFNNCWHFAMQARYRVKVQKNTELHTEWHAMPGDIRPLLTAGDIIEFGDRSKESSDRPNSLFQFQEFAIYIERSEYAGLFASIVTTAKTKEVAHLSRPTNEPNGKTVVCLVGIEDFFTVVVKDKDFRINNQWDSMWQPNDCADTVKYVLGSNGMEDPYFVIGARYGEKARDKVQGRDLSKALHELTEQFYLKRDVEL